MEATKDHISLQTAELLKGKLKNQEISCFFKSIKGDEYILVKCDGGEYRYEDLYDLPAYTWQEILWENAYKLGAIKVSEYIVLALRTKNYEAADECFRNNCILINNP